MSDNEYDDLFDDEDELEATETEGEGESELDADSDAERLSKLVAESTAREAAKAKEQAEFKAKVKGILGQADPEWEPSKAELSVIEKAAQDISRVDASNRAELFAMLKAGNDAITARSRAGTDGFDHLGEPVAVKERFNPMTLDSQGFRTYTDAISGRPLLGRPIPAGMSPQAWAEAIAEGRER